ncbi:hypothetical protein V6N12_073335 [Hibiscus sabdariffa]|uniref:Uncharacterized protein n=1 Tax=Hibiscus sabdariffa TaxID=183260 RepID=A0ABR2AP20_9ROSI
MGFGNCVQQMAGSNDGVFSGRLTTIACTVGWDECGYIYACKWLVAMTTSSVADSRQQLAQSAGTSAATSTLGVGRLLFYAIFISYVGRIGFLRSLRLIAAIM